MAILTKSTLITYKETTHNVPEEFIVDIMEKIPELKSAGKTNAEYDFIDDHSIRRNWLDQAAVDEWLVFFTACLEKHGVEAEVLVEETSIPM